jgi:hypothetical protein
MDKLRVAHGHFIQQSRNGRLPLARLLMKLGAEADCLQIVIPAPGMHHLPAALNPFNSRVTIREPGA